MTIRNITSFSTLIISGIFVSTLLVACDKMPTECQTTWKNIEKLATGSGIPADALEEQKKQFEQNINNLNKKDAIQSCNAQNKVFELYQ